MRGQEPPPAAAAGDDARPGPRVPRRPDRRRPQRARRPVRHLPGHLRPAAQRLRPRRGQAGQARGDDDDDGEAVDDATGERTQVRRRYPKLEGFRTDPSWWSVAALEVFDDDTGEATPAPILQRPIIEAAREVWPDRADDDRAGRRQLAGPLAPHRPRLRRRPARRRPRPPPRRSWPRSRSARRRGSGSSPPTTWPVTSSASSTTPSPPPTPTPGSTATSTPCAPCSRRR